MEASDGTPIPEGAYLIEGDGFEDIHPSKQAMEENIIGMFENDYTNRKISITDQAGREFGVIIGAELVRAYTRTKAPKKKKPVKTAEEREEVRKRGLRKWYADQAAARREIFGWLKRQRAIKESEEE